MLNHTIRRLAVGLLLWLYKSIPCAFLLHAARCCARANNTLQLLTKAMLMITKEQSGKVSTPLGTRILNYYQLAASKR